MEKNSRYSRIAIKEQLNNSHKYVLKIIQIAALLLSKTLLKLSADTSKDAAELNLPSP